MLKDTAISGNFPYQVLKLGELLAAKFVLIESNPPQLKII